MEKGIGMKRLGIMVLISILLLSVFPGVSKGLEDIKLIVNDYEIVSTDEKAIVNKEGKAYVPVRCIGEILGEDVSWDKLSRSFVIKKGEEVIKIPVGQKYIKINNIEFYYDANAYIEKGQGMLPLRVIAELLNCSVDWRSEEDTFVIEITSKELQEKTICCSSFVVPKDISCQVEFYGGNDRFWLVTDLELDIQEDTSLWWKELAELLSQRIPSDLVGDALKYAQSKHEEKEMLSKKFYFDEGEKFIHVYSQKYWDNVVITVYKY